jgi:transcriptional regulator with PAS, ATPase and Fis domain
MVEDGEFREDLLYRLRVLPIEVPPLRHRREDLRLLIQHFLKEAGVSPTPTIPAEVHKAFEAYSWPGNVRELQNELKRLLVVGDGEIDVANLSEQVLDTRPRLQTDGQQVADLGHLVESIETREIGRALSLAEGNKSKAADLLGISRFTLQRKLDKYGIKVDES